MSSQSGQRQILALARGLVRRSKVIILDEATASVDQTTEERVQQIIRSEFMESTLITISHRLRAIMEYDKVLVLDKGKIVEWPPDCISLKHRFDTPLKLLEKKGMFHEMVLESGEYNELMQIAKNRYEDRARA